MSETRINMRKIVGLTDDLANLAPQGNRPRIGMGLGVAYAAGYHAGNDGGLGSADGSGDLGDKDADADSQDNGPTPREEGEGLHDASEALPPTGEVPGLGGLYDCDSGRCVNVRFDGIVPPPEGWEDACAPPVAEKPYYGYRVSLNDYPAGTTRHVWVWSGINDVRAAILKHLNSNPYLEILEHSSNPNNPNGYGNLPDGTLFVIKSHIEYSRREVMRRSDDHFRHSTGFGAVVYKVGTSLGMRIATNMGNYSAGSDPFPSGNPTYEAAWAENPLIERWPAAQCSEVAYDAANAGFKDGTCGNDPLMPQHLQGQYSGFELCDKDGNKVRVKRTRYGIEVEQEKHGRVTTLDPDTFKVVNQLIKQAP